MRRVRKLELEQIGDDLCVVYVGHDSKYRGVLGAIDGRKLDAIAVSLAAAAMRYKEQSSEEFRAVFYEI